MSALSKLLPKNNKAYVVPTSTLRPVKPQEQQGLSMIEVKPKRGRKKAVQNAEPKPRKQKTPKKDKSRISKDEMRRIKQQEAENRAVNEYYAKQNRRKHAIISNYVKKAEQEKVSPPVPATMKNPNSDRELNIKNPPKIISLNKYLNTMAASTVEKPNKRPVAINRIINNYRLIVDPDNIDKTLDKLRLKKQFDSINVEPTDSTSMIKAKIKLADTNRAKDIERRLLQQRT